MEGEIFPGASQPSAGPLQELAALSTDQERDVLNRILTRGYDQGCFLRPPAGSLLSVSTAALHTALEALSDRDGTEPSEADPFESEPVPAGAINGSGEGQVVLTQRCDLVRGFCDEPLIELARASLVEEHAVITAAKQNSPRLIHLCDHANGAWVIDLRNRSVLAKHHLIEHEVVLPVAPGRPRRDLALRLHRRYSRDAIPDDIVREFQRPLVEWLRDKKARRRKTELFSEFLVQRSPDGALLVLGVIGADRSRVDAEKAFRELMEGFAQKTAMTIAPESDAVTEDDLPLGLWKRAHKLDLDQLSRGSKASKESAEPNR